MAPPVRFRVSCDICGAMSHVLRGPELLDCDAEAHAGGWLIDRSTGRTLHICPTCFLPSILVVVSAALGVDARD